MVSLSRYPIEEEEKESQSNSNIRKKERRKKKHLLLCRGTATIERVTTECHYKRSPIHCHPPPHPIIVIPYRVGGKTVVYLVTSLPGLPDLLLGTK